MPWIDDEQPSRTRDELLRLVERRGRELRRRRRAGLGLAPVVAVVTALALGALMTSGDGGGRPVQLATAGPSTTTAGETLADPPPNLPDQPGSTTSTALTGGPPATGPDPRTAPPPLRAGFPFPPSPPPIPPPVATPTTPAVPTTFTTSPEPPPRQPRCQAADVEVTVTRRSRSFAPVRSSSPPARSGTGRRRPAITGPALGSRM